MKKIMIAGLGLIGGSMAKALRRAGYAVDGWDREEVIFAAQKAGAIQNEAKNFADYDVVFLALPPDLTMKLIDTSSFRDGAIVADICGVKEAIESCVYARERNFRYIGCHPMAGREVSGFENSLATLFDGASVILVENEKTDPAALSEAENYFLQMGCACIKRCGAKYHDKKIAYTSQLAHIVSNAYVKSPTAQGFSGFTGGSFQDMTRIAGVDEAVWARLYMLNRDSIREELSFLISRLREYEAALRAGDEERLSELLREGRLRKEVLDAEKKIL